MKWFLFFTVETQTYLQRLVFSSTKERGSLYRTFPQNLKQMQNAERSQLSREGNVLVQSRVVAF